jgi:NAD(P)-dependent dehydrogenase (short-subunit alcohol dehydrogenase family)
MASQHHALIVGGGTGIGRATAGRLVRRGVAVALCGRRETVLRDAQQLLRASTDGATVEVVPGDAGVEAEAARIVNTVVHRLGGLDLCVLCAGLYEPVDFLAMEKESWQRTIQSTLDAVVYPAVAAARAMAAQGGRFVLVSSVGAVLSEPDSAHYNAAKAAVSSLARSMAVDLASRGIQVNALVPGWVHTPMTDGFVQNATPETLKLLNPVARVGQPDELANVIEYLLLDAPDYLNGTAIIVDGGQTAMAPII